MPKKKETPQSWPADEEHWRKWLPKEYESASLSMKMMHKSYVMAKIDALKGREDLTQILQLTSQPKKKVDPQGEPADPEPGTSKRKPGAGDGDSSAGKKKDPLTADSFRSVQVKGTMPKGKKGQFTGGQQAAGVYGLRNWMELTMLQEYLHLNGKFELKYVQKNGSCMWQSILECSNYPAEYQVQMLQRQVVLLMVEHADFFFPILRSHIEGTYGCLRLSPEEYQKREKEGKLTTAQIEDQAVPGPFSFLTYLEYLLQENIWRDYAVALCVSFMWQVKLTIIVVDTTHPEEDQWIRQELIRHESSLKRADLVLVFCGGNHYIPAVAWTREKGYDEPVPLRLMCGPLEKVGQYDLSQEDPSVFKNVDPEVPREWPDIPLPTYQAQTEAAVAAATRSKTQQVQPPPQPEPQSKLVQELLEIHRSYVDVLLSMGVDPLKAYEEKKAENILSGVKSGDTKCKVCDKRCSSTQKLKNHIRRQHIGKTPFYCGECNRYYGDSQSLKVHLRKHLPEEEKKAAAHTCPTCSRSYSSLGKLNEHLEKHMEIKCRYCGKTFAYNRTCKAHEAENCPERPGVKEPEEGEEQVPLLHWYCHICSSDFGACRNLKKHLNQKHGGADIAKDAHH